VRELVTRGHSRVPIFRGPEKTSCTDFLLLKDHLLLNPADARPVATLRTHTPIWVGPESSLFGLLNSFQEGHAHMAFVSRHPELAARAVRERGESPSGRSRCIGVITLEDIIEEILTEEIYDESDVDHAHETIRDFVKKYIRPRLDQKRSTTDVRQASMRMGVGPADSASTALGGVQPPAAGAPAAESPPSLTREFSTRLKVLRGKTLAAKSVAAAAAPAATVPRVAAAGRQGSALTEPLLVAAEQPPQPAQPPIGSNCSSAAAASGAHRPDV